MMNHGIQDAWAAMEKLVEKGLVKNIGMSNFNSKQLTDLMEDCKILPAVLQVVYLNNMISI